MRQRNRLERRLCIVLVCGAAVLGCQSQQEQITEEHLERARASLDPLKRELVETLTSALDDGPEAAIRVCRDAAPAIAARLASDGIELGRTSHRLRNPANAPAAWMEPLLAGYVETPEQREPRSVRLAEGRFGYVEPIYTGELCLQCHGPSVPPETQELLASLYPEDQAIGFAAGELRGMFWVTMALD